MSKLTKLERALRAVPYEKPDRFICPRFPCQIGGCVYVTDGGGMVRFVGSCPPPQIALVDESKILRYWDETTGSPVALDPRDVIAFTDQTWRGWRDAGEPKLKAWRAARREAGRQAVAEAKAWWKANKFEVVHVRSDKPATYVEKGRGSAPDVPRIREAAEAAWARANPQPDELPLVKHGDQEFDARRLARLIRLVKPTRALIRDASNGHHIMLFGATFDAILMAVKEDR